MHNFDASHSNRVDIEKILKSSQYIIKKIIYFTDFSYLIDQLNFSIYSLISSTKCGSSARVGVGVNSVDFLKYLGE